MTYPTSPDWSKGRFMGPTSTATPSFPTVGVYLNGSEWARWQIEAQLVLNQEASGQIAPLCTQYGIANPYTPIIAGLMATLAALPPLATS